MLHVILFNFPFETKYVNNKNHVKHLNNKYLLELLPSIVKYFKRIGKTQKTPDFGGFCGGNQ